VTEFSLSKLMNTKHRHYSFECEQKRIHCLKHWVVFLIIFIDTIQYAYVTTCRMVDTEDRLASTRTENQISKELVASCGYRCVPCVWRGKIIGTYDNRNSDEQDE
jgi:hypothetical protein